MLTGSPKSPSGDTLPPQTSLHRAAIKSLELQHQHAEAVKDLTACTSVCRGVLRSFPALSELFAQKTNQRPELRSRCIQ